MGGGNAGYNSGTGSLDGGYNSGALGSSCVRDGIIIW